MYPANYFSLFPAFPQTTKIFVAMSFAERFKPRFENVISKAISHIEHNGVRCEPLIVNARTVSDSILTEILDGIRSSFLVFADISTVRGRGKTAVRNGNVMYEVGIAHAVRLPEEVILFRSDDDRLLFDTSNVRVNHYDPDGSPKKAHDAICDAIINAAREVDLRRHMAVQRVAGMLDHSAWMLLTVATTHAVKHPTIKTMRDVMSNISVLPAINKLLELGVICMKPSQLSLSQIVENELKTAEEMIEYHVTPFGRTVFQQVGSQMTEMLGLRTQDDFKRLQDIIERESGEELRS